MPSADELIAATEPAFDALERGDLDGFIEVTSPWVTPETVFHSGIGSAVGAGDYRGVEGLREWFGDLLEITSYRRWSNRRCEKYGDDVVLFLADLEFTGAASGAPVTTQTASVYRLSDGVCTNIDSFTSYDDGRSFVEALVA